MKTVFSSSRYLYCLGASCLACFLLPVRGGGDPSCLDLKSVEACGEAEGCVWCVSAAIPSECVPAAQAGKLPPSVFHCDFKPDSSSSSSSPKPALQSLSLAEVLSVSEDLFEGWKVIHEKRYKSEDEEESRFAVFEATLESVARHNAKEDSPYRLEVNKFADMTHEEFLRTRLGGLGGGQNCSATHRPVASPFQGVEIPVEIDWRKVGAVSPVKDQGKCGSCWTFSTTGAMESHHFLNTGEMVLLSEQQLVDCASHFDNHGCNGGLPSHAFEYIASAGGLDTEESYPYNAVQGECRFDTLSVGATAMGSFNITFQDERMLEGALGKYGPVSVAFQVAGDFKSYAGGVYVNPECSTLPSAVNHAVLAVGYGTDQQTGLDYYIIKNSWGANWGEDGYFKMLRGANQCGIADCASFPLIHSGVEEDSILSS